MANYSLDPMEDMVADRMEYRSGFESFKSNICHMVRNMGDIDFPIETLETGKIRALYEKAGYVESLYLLAMVDYLSRENDLPLYLEYDDIRCKKLQKTIYSAGVLALCVVSISDEPKTESLREAMPEFLRHNIVKAEARNVC